MYLFLFDEQRLNDSFIYVYSTCIVNDWLKNNCVVEHARKKLETDMHYYFGQLRGIIL